MLEPLIAVVAVLATTGVLVLLRRLRRLRASERLYRTIVERAPDVSILMVDRDLRFRLVEGSALEHDGRRREELVGKLVTDVFPADRAEEFSVPVRAALRGETTHVAWNGTRGHAHYALLFGPFDEPGQGITHAICIVRDVTAKLDATRELDEQRGFLASLLEWLSGTVYVCDADGRLLRFGDGRLGFDTDMHPLEWAGAFGLMHPDGTPMGPHEAPLLRALRGEGIDGVEILVDGPRGRAALLCSGGPVHSPDGRLLGAVVTATDLTGRRETEELLRVSEERHRRVVESMTDCVFETDERGRWTYLNAAWTAATGYAVAETLGRPAVEYVHADDRACHLGAFQPLLRGEQGAVQLSHRFVTREGAIRWAEVRASAISGWDGLPTGFVGVMRDVTDEQRTRQHAAAEQAVVRLLGDAHSLHEAAPRLLEVLCRDLEWDTAELWQMGDDERLRRTAEWTRPGLDLGAFRRAGGEQSFEVGDGLPGQAWMSREPLWCTDLQTDGGLTRAREADALELRSGVALPLRADGAPVGVVQLFSRLHRDPESGLLRPFETIGAHIGQFMHRREAERRAAEQAADLAAISGVAHDLAAQNDMYAARTTLVRAVRQVTGASCVILWELAGEELEVTAADGAAVRGMTLPLDASTVTAAVFSTGEPAFAGDLHADRRITPRWREISGAGSSAWIPVHGDGRIHGVLAVGWPETRESLSAREAELLRLLAAEAAVTIHRTALLGSLEATARTDPLTGLPNRRVWDEDLERELARARRHGGSLCLAMLDLDRFKAFNDDNGHQAGDRLLAAAAAAWRPMLRATDTLARYGGEEFAVLLPHSDHEAARTVVERLLLSVPLGQTASAGIAVWDGAETAEQLLARADSALYSAKGAGRARAVTAV
ncbi:diguanylate cyclase domain-containing protein [Candidatus Solirubrobacter pratensis]|uniref:diguanylate cyclase domain-containing protein n=1 Tax=Candidatus Solirubrobacter pratensis TaxID=1298857 RepID=UPI000415562C|nr:diguanylate cyclase [Candidatus Solirubrobacter pratensis]